MEFQCLHCSKLCNCSRLSDTCRPDKDNDSRPLLLRLLVDGDAFSNPFHDLRLDSRIIVQLTEGEFAFEPLGYIPYITMGKFIFR